LYAKSKNKNKFIAIKKNFKERFSLLKIALDILEKLLKEINKYVERIKKKT
jgi:hypothetical protein